MAKGPNFELLREHTDKYHLALGRFASAFSQVEATLLMVLWGLARVRAPYAQAVLSGVRIEGAMGYINRIADAERWSNKKRAEWQRIFTQLGLINKLRNDILHYGASIHGNFWLVSNRNVAHDPGRIREILITPSILEDAAADLGDIQLHLVVLGGRRSGIMLIGEPRSALRKRLLRRAWRYKQPPQADWIQTLLNTPPKRKRGPRS